MLFEKYVPGKEKNAAYHAIHGMMDGFDTNRSYADMIRLRLTGELAEECCDTYYVAHEDGKCFSRLWMGWGDHPDAIGNWGNFYTDAEARGRGIGGGLLRLWDEDLRTVKNPPLAFFCTASSLDLLRPYGKFGWRSALKGDNKKPLYLPIGSSPETFQEFCEMYYKPASVLYARPATIGYRHEIDCLLKFAFMDMGLKFGISGINAEAALLYHPGKAKMLFSEDGHCVGWSFNRINQIHPLYEKAEIITV